MPHDGLDTGTRIAALRRSMLTRPAICLERGYLMTEAYRESEGQPEVIRRARALARILGEMTVFIEDGELIVGRGSSKARGGILTPELAWAWYLEEIDLIATREWDRFAPLTAEEKTKMREFLPYWRGKTLSERWQAMVPEKFHKLYNTVFFGAAFCKNNQYYGHVGVDYGRVLTRGLGGLRQDVQEHLARLNLASLADLHKYHFLTAADIALESAGGLARRYAGLAAAMAGGETDRRRQAELRRIAAVCNWIATNPPRSFYEALQLTWLAYLVIIIESPGTGVGFLRPDQYLYPFYRKDIAAGTITREEVRELIALFYIKTNGLVIPYPTTVVKSFAGFTLGANFTLGGLTEDGEDAVNELSYLFLEAEKAVALNSEDIIIRIGAKTPDDFILKACEVARALRGKLKFVSDETIIGQLTHDGKPLAWARSYAVTGCNSPTVPGRSLDVPGGMSNMPLMLELALNNGVSRRTGERLGPATGDPRRFATYEDVWTAYTRQVEALIPAGLLFKNADKQLFADYAPSPFQSTLYHGCIERGVDVINGGTAPYISHAISVSGTPNVGDALAAIRKVVFEEKKITMKRLIDALDTNFAEDEEVLHLLSRAPKFGNDDPYVDSIVNAVITHASGEAARVRGFAGAVSNVAAGTITSNIPMGYLVGALPDGRRAGEPIAEGGISPYQGRNVSGPTATMLSVARLDHLQMTNGSVLNMRLNPDMVKDEAKLKKLASMVKTYLLSGGFFVQFNIVSTDTLRDAQRHSEKYRDLLVRVSTYSAYFVELTPELQNDIIARMEFGA